MSFLQTIRDDVNKLANHTLDLGKFTAQIEAKVASEMEAFKAEVMSRVDKMLSDLKSEIMGGVEAQASQAVAALGTEVASITGSVVSDMANSVSPSGPAAPTSVNDLVAADVPEAAPAHISVAVVAHDEAVANGSTPDVAHADTVAAAAQAGAEPDMAVKIADSVATNPPSAPATL